MFVKYSDRGSEVQDSNINGEIIDIPQVRLNLNLKVIDEVPGLDPVDPRKLYIQISFTYGKKY